MVEYKTGYFASSLCGHDKGRIYMIIREEGDRVALCDGKRRLYDHPKYKKKKHVQMIRSEETAAEFSRRIESPDKDAWIRGQIAGLRAKKK